MSIYIYIYIYIYILRKREGIAVYVGVAIYYYVTKVSPFNSDDSSMTHPLMLVFAIY